MNAPLRQTDFKIEFGVLLHDDDDSTTLLDTLDQATAQGWRLLALHVSALAAEDLEEITGGEPFEHDGEVVSVVHNTELMPGRAALELERPVR